MRRIAAALLMLVCASLAVARVDLPDAVRAEVAPMQLLGSGRMTWFGLHVYDAALWSPANASASGLPPNLDAPFALALRYSRDFQGERIAERSLVEIERLDFGTTAERQRWLAAMRELFPDVRAGETLTGLYRPGVGAEFYHQDRRLGRIDDAAFARAFFSIWLDPRTRAPRLREQLIGNR